MKIYIKNKIKNNFKSMNNTKQKKVTNVPFQALNAKILAFIPASVSIDVKYSANGINYEKIGDTITGPETLQINDVKPGAWFKFESASNDVVIDVIL